MPDQLSSPNVTANGGLARATTHRGQSQPQNGEAMIGALILGLVAGALGRLLMPGKDPGGIVVTILLGLAGSLVGYLIFSRALGIGDDDAFDLGGLLSATIGVMIVLGLYRWWAGRVAA